MHNTKCMCYEIYTWLNFPFFYLHENKVTANISGYTVYGLHSVEYTHRHVFSFNLLKDIIAILGITLSSMCSYNNYIYIIKKCP